MLNNDARTIQGRDNHRVVTFRQISDVVGVDVHNTTSRNVNGLRRYRSIQGSLSTCTIGDSFTKE